MRILSSLLHIFRRRPLATVATGVVLVIALNTAAQLRLNVWNGDFYGALEQRDLPTFLNQLGVFFVLAGILLVFVVAQTFLQEVAKVRLREKITRNLLDRWLVPRRAFELNLAGEVGANPDQRLQEDVKHLSELGVGIAAGFVQSSMLLLTFVGVLWTLSTAVPVTVFGHTVVIHGLMLWGTLAFSLAGSLLTYFVGAPLIRLHQQRYAREAELRFAIVRVAESAQEIAFYRGEGQERVAIDAIFQRVTAVMMGLAGAVARVTWVTSGYGWLAIVAPVIVASPAYFRGDLTFGQLMMVVQAFFQVQQSLRWFVDNYATIADWRATRRRVLEFSRAVDEVDRLGEGESRIAVLPSPDGNLVFDHVRVKLPAGVATFDHDVEIVRQGERVLIVGEHGSGKGMLFRALAGLWPWGEGTILVPPTEDVMFLTQRPYLPLGSLRAALSYPAGAARWDDASLMTALSRVGLADLAASLDVVKRWDRELTVEQQERLSFARILLHRPKWLLLDEATSATICDDRHMMLAMLNEELSDVSVVGLARVPSTDGLYDRVIRLHRAPSDRLRLELPHAPEPARGGVVRAAAPPPARTAPGRVDERRPADLVGAKP